jgi:hypothetical protein
MFRLATFKNTRMHNGYRHTALGLLRLGRFDMFYMAWRRANRSGTVFFAVRVMGLEVGFSKHSVCFGCFLAKHDYCFNFEKS